MSVNTCNMLQEISALLFSLHGLLPFNKFNTNETKTRLNFSFSLNNK